MGSTNCKYAQNGTTVTVVSLGNTIKKYIKNGENYIIIDNDTQFYLEFYFGPNGGKAEVSINGENIFEKPYMFTKNPCMVITSKTNGESGRLTFYDNEESFEKSGSKPISDPRKSGVISINLYKRIGSCPVEPTAPPAKASAPPADASAQRFAFPTDNHSAFSPPPAYRYREGGISSASERGIPDGAPSLYDNDICRDGPVEDNVFDDIECDGCSSSCQLTSKIISSSEQPHTFSIAKAAKAAKEDIPFTRGVVGVSGTHQMKTKKEFDDSIYSEPISYHICMISEKKKPKKYMKTDFSIPPILFM